METVRPSTLQKIKDLYEFMETQKDPTDNRTRLFSYELANAIDQTTNKVGALLSVLVGLDCIRLVKRSSGSYYPSIYELIKPPTTHEYLKFRERAAGRGAIKISPSATERQRMDIEELKAKIQNLEEIVKSLLVRDGQLETK